jgi:NADH-quinone oxidoreductase subunit M
MATLLLTTLLLPLAGAVLLPGDRALARRWALGVVLAVFGLAVILAAVFPGGVEPFAGTDVAVAKASPIDVRFSIALDGLSLWLYELTALLMIVAVAIGWEAIDDQPQLYYRLLLVLESGMLGVFVARDILLFYVFFEFTLIPLFFLIGIWGGSERRHAAVKFFLFTLAGSLLTFLGLLAIVVWNYAHPIGDPLQWKMTFSISQITETLTQRPMDGTMQLWIFVALFAGFAIKTPLFPLHTWLPLAHVEAPTAGSVLLAGVLLKVGVYGFLRFSIAMLPSAAMMLMPWLLGISLAGIVYGALTALAQRDIKRLIAYSSVSHMGFCMLGLFALNRLSVEGGVLQMVNHGLATGGLFAMVGMIYERYHTRQIDDYGGLAQRLPVLAFFMFVLTLSSIGVPGLNGFVGEFLVLLGTFQRCWTAAPTNDWFAFRILGSLGIVGVVLGAWYMLWLYQRVFFGPWKEPRRHAAEEATPDLCWREIGCLIPLVVLMVWIGLYPRFFLDRMKPTLEQLTAPAMKELTEPVNVPTALTPDPSPAFRARGAALVPNP